jgi:hypothetical protein
VADGLIRLNSTPREFRHRPSSLKVKTFILAGTQPALPLEIEERNNTAIMGIVHAMRKAFTFNPRKRPSERKIANLLVDVSDKVERARSSE